MRMNIKSPPRTLKGVPASESPGSLHTITFLKSTSVHYTGRVVCHLTQALRTDPRHYYLEAAFRVGTFYYFSFFFPFPFFPSCREKISTSFLKYLIHLLFFYSFVVVVAFFLLFPPPSLDLFLNQKLAICFHWCCTCLQLSAPSGLGIPRKEGPSLFPHAWQDACGSKSGEGLDR